MAIVDERPVCDEPIQILSAESVAREVISLELMNELWRANKVILAAKENGKKSCKFQGYMSEATKIVIRKAGYELYGEDSDYVEISWEDIYSKLSENEEVVMQIAEELGIQFVSLEEYHNRVIKD